MITLAIMIDFKKQRQFLRGFIMKKLISILVINTVLTSCANLPHTPATGLSKIANSIAPSLNNSIGQMSSSHSPVASVVSSNSKSYSKKAHSKKTKKTTPTPTLLSSLNNSKITATDKKTQTNIANAVEVAKVAVNTLAVIGGQLASYFTQQDKENAVKVLKNTEKTAPVAWCSDSSDVSENVDEVKCSSSRKIIQTPGEVVKKEDKVCRSLKTEVVTENGDIQTETQHLCQAENGEWYDDKSA
jgi:hypothetical protein